METQQKNPKKQTAEQQTEVSVTVKIKTKESYRKSHRPLKISLIVLAAFIIISAAVMSTLMVTSKIEYSKMLRPFLKDIYSITVMNDNTSSSSRKELLNTSLGYTDNTNEGQAIRNILGKLYKSSKTNRFAQFFGGQANGDETIRYNYIGSASSTAFTEAAGGTYIKIRFDAPVYVINGPKTALNVQAYNPEYEQEFDDNNTALGLTSYEYHRNRVVNAIYIPLGNTLNRFENQTWYLCLGADGTKYDQTNYTSINYTLSTYGNYSDLSEYVKSIDESVF